MKTEPIGNRPAGWYTDGLYFYGIIGRQCYKVEIESLKTADLSQSVVTKIRKIYHNAPTVTRPYGIYDYLPQARAAIRLKYGANTKTP